MALVYVVALGLHSLELKIIMIFLFSESSILLSVERTTSPKFFNIIQYINEKTINQFT